MIDSFSLHHRVHWPEETKNHWLTTDPGAPVVGILRLESPHKYKLGHMTICFVGSSFCLPEKKPNNKRHHQPKPFPIRIALIHRLKTRLIPFKNAKKPIKNFAKKVMDIVTLFIVPLSYIAFKELD